VRTLLLVLHIGAAILLIGPTTVATSAFARYATADALPVAESLHRIGRVYGPATLLVAAAGLALAQRGAMIAQGWLLASLLLFAVGWALLMGVILPDQARALVLARRDPAALAPLRARLRAASGVYAAIWLVVLVLMVAKPF
jgi:uncharacterized membrane protein